MTYSKIERSFWETDEARELTPEEKYFWMYLQTNANVNTLGCYAFRMRKAVDETGYNKDTLEKLLDIMIQRGMIRCDNEGDFPSALGQDELEPPDSNPARDKSRFEGDPLRNDKIQNKHAVRKKRHFYEGRRK